MNCSLFLSFSLSLSLIIIVSSLMRLYYSTAINIPSLSLLIFWSLETFFSLGPRGGVVVFRHRGGWGKQEGRSKLFPHRVSIRSFVMVSNWDGYTLFFIVNQII
jgi:hypothetical protein